MKHHPCLAAFTLIAGLSFAVALRAAQVWRLEEIALTATHPPAGPAIDVAVLVEFTAPDRTLVRVPGFWDGGLDWRVRFTPTMPGAWTYRIRAEPAIPGVAREGTLTVAPAARGDRGFLRRDAEFAQSFRFDGGERPFMWGNTAYHLVATAQTEAPWPAALASMRAAGLNKVRFHLGSIPVFEKAGPHPASPAFLDADTTRPNFAHWRAADAVVRACADAGLLAELIVWPYIRAGDDDSTVRDARYRRMVIARYAAFPHVMWCLTNEWNYSRYPREFWIDLGRRFAAEDPWTLDPATHDARAPRALTIHQQTRPDWNFSEETWPSHANIQLGVRNRGTTARVGDEWRIAGTNGAVFRLGDDWGHHSIVRNWTGRQPVVNDEYGYIGEPEDRSEPPLAPGRWPALSRDKHRRIAWAIAVGGGYGASGDKRDFPAGRPYYSGLWQPAPDYDDVSRLIAFFTRSDVPFWRMRPAQELVAGAPRVYALADAGRCYVFYAATGGTFRAALPPGKFTATRYDPRTGEEQPLAIAGEGVREFALPAGEDWVARVMAAP